MAKNNGMDSTASRLRYFAHTKYGNIKSLAEAMGVSPSTLSQYTTGKCVPGNLMQERLRSLGCDIEWLITGSSVTHEIKKMRREFALLMKEYRAFQQRLSNVEENILDLNGKFKNNGAG